MNEVRFVVEHAGCNSCASRVRQALEAIATVHEVTVDESGDVAFVSLASAAVSEQSVNEALREASTGSGHEYSVRPGSWRA
jgi:copper chaperone CopZ